MLDIVKPWRTLVKMNETVVQMQQNTFEVGIHRFAYAIVFLCDVLVWMYSYHEDVNIINI